MAGILMYTFFNQSLTQAADSIASNGGVLTKIYVPPQVFAISSALAGLANFFIGMLPLALVCLISGQALALTLPLVLVVGVSYKANVSDTREAPAALVINELQKLGAEVSWHDPVVGTWNGQNSCELKGFDAAIVVTKHDVVSESDIKACAPYIFDCTGSIKGVAGL
jgi:hypothetical protein